MKKALILIVFLVSLIKHADAQWVHSPNDKIESLNWGIIDMILFKKVNDTTVYPVYNERVRKFDKRRFELTGYMIPMKPGMKQTSFLLATLPINQCYFCGKNGNPIMILVKTANPVAFTFKTVTVEGVLNLYDTNAYFLPPVSLLNASIKPL